MQNHTHSQHLGVFGWNFSFIGDIKLTTDSDDNVYIANSNLESILPAQLSGTALYDTSESGLPLNELIDSPYRLNSQELLRRYSSSKRIFEKQADGSYQGNDGTLTWNVDHYELENRDGSLIVFRADGQLNYIEDSNGYRVTANYTEDLLTGLDANNGDSFTLSYNSHGRIETITDQTEQTNTYNYDSTGQYLLSIEDANGTTSFEYENPYDPTLVTEVTYEDSTQDKYFYNAKGLLNKWVNRRGQEIRYNYNDNNQLVKEIYEDGSIIEYEYDPVIGLFTSVSDDSSGGISQFSFNQAEKKLSITTNAFIHNLHSYTFDELGRKTQIIIEDGLSRITYKDSTQDKYFYNAKRLINKWINRGSQEIRYNYNDNNQLTKEIYEDGKIIEYGYDPNSGYLTRVSNGGSNTTTQFNYNQAQNTLTINHPGELIHSYTFDNLGRKTQITIQDGTNTRTLF